MKKNLGRKKKKNRFVQCERTGFKADHLSTDRNRFEKAEFFSNYVLGITGLNECSSESDMSHSFFFRF
jgi:hypothetical protein